MPTFEGNEVTIQDDNENEVTGEVDIEFEIYCADCGAGICDHAEVMKTYRRQMNRIDIKQCNTCWKREYDERKELEAEIMQLRAALEQARRELISIRANP